MKTITKIFAYQRKLESFKLQNLRDNLFANQIVKNQNQNKGNNHYSESNQRLGINIKNINFILHSNFLKIRANPKQTITPNKSAVKIRNLLAPFSFKKLGTITKAPNQPAARFTNSSEKTEAKFGSNLINFNLTNRFRSVNGSN